MSLLGKYRSKDGFVQLMRLLELSESDKQKNLLLLLGDEDPGWARLIRIKMLTREKILAWPSDVLSQILASLDAQTTAAALLPQESLKDQSLKANVKRSVPARVFREINLALEKMSFTEQEKVAGTIKLIQTVREMEQLGLIDLGKVDQSLIVDQRLIA